MYRRKLELVIRCPFEYGLNMVGEKWKTRIICVLSSKKTLRYTDLKNKLINVTDTVLATTLKEMMADEIIDRTQYNEILPRVEYSLTDKGLSVVPILQSICRWSSAYRDGENEELFTECRTCENNLSSF